MGTTNLSLGIEISEPTIKLALLDQKNKKVLRLGCIQVSQHPLRDISTLESTIAEWVAENPEVKASHITLSIPSQHCVVRRLELPPDIPNKREYIEWEFSTVINAPRNEYYLDFHELSAKKAKIAIVSAIRKSWLEPFRKNFSNRELIPSQVEVDSFSILNLLENAIIGANSGVSCIVKVDRTGVIVVWGKDGVLETTQWLNVAPYANMNPDQAYHALAVGLKKKLSAGAYQVGYAAVEGVTVHLCGDLSVNNEFVEVLKAQVPDTHFELLSSLHRIYVDSDLIAQKMVPLCAAAIGAALRYREDRK